MTTAKSKTAAHARTLLVGPLLQPIDDSVTYASSLSSSPALHDYDLVIMRYSNSSLLQTPKDKWNEWIGFIRAGNMAIIWGIDSSIQRYAKELLGADMPSLTRLDGTRIQWLDESPLGHALRKKQDMKWHTHISTPRHENVSVIGVNGAGLPVAFGMGVARGFVAFLPEFIPSINPAMIRRLIRVEASIKGRPKQKGPRHRPANRMTDGKVSQLRTSQPQDSNGYPKPELLDALNRMKLILIAAATGGDRYDEEYEELRQAVMESKPLERQLPSFVRVCRTLEEFWSYIKSEYRTYPERRSFINASLRPALSLLEKEDDLSSEADSAVPNQQPAVHQTVARQNGDQMDYHPRCFVSYTEKDGDLQWILSLAEQLTEKGGVDVHLYEWDKYDGLDLPSYMEENISESDYILVICSPAYARRANKREHGVGYETTIITGGLYRESKSIHHKIIPVLRKGEPTTSIPTYAQTLSRVDMRIDDDFNEKLEELLRAIYKVPKYKKPKVGDKPNLESKSSEFRPTNAKDVSAVHGALSDRNARFKKDALDSKWIVPRNTSGSPAILVSIIPESIVREQKLHHFDVKLVGGFLQPLGSASWNPRITGEGVLSTTSHNNSSVLFRWDGTIEAFDERFLGRPEINGQNAHNLKLLPLVELRNRILACVGKYVEAMKTVHVDFPVDIFINLHGLRGFCAVELGYDAKENPILSDSIDLEARSITNASDLERALLPAFDSLAKSCGLQRFEYAKR